MPFTPEYLISVFLVFVRTSGLFVAAPFFGNRAVPVRVKVLFALIMAYALVGMVTRPLPPETFHPFGLIVAVFIEAATGLLLGFTAQFVFWTIQYAGEVLGFQMGLSMAHVYNPIDGTHSNPLGKFLLMTFLLLFILLDGHHQLLRALTASFLVVPLAGANLAAGGPLLLTWMGHFFLTALRLAAPFMITTFMLDLTLGVFARVVPQTDLFSLGLPIKLFVGFGLTLFYLTNFFPVVPSLIEGMYDQVMAVIEAIAQF